MNALFDFILILLPSSFLFLCVLCASVVKSFSAG